MDVESQLLDRNLLSIPHDRLPASEIKPTFLSTNSGLPLLVFEQQQQDSTFSYSKTYPLAFIYLHM